MLLRIAEYLDKWHVTCRANLIAGASTRDVWYMAKGLLLGYTGCRHDRYGCYCGKWQNGQCIYKRGK